MSYILAITPIIVILVLMVVLRWGGQKAGPTAWFVGIVIAALAFGLNWQVFWVSQIRGILLSLYLLVMLWPALLMYNLVNQVGGIRAMAEGLQRMISDRGMLLITLAWCFSGILEGLAGFGIPVAIISPMLVSLGVPALTAVAAAAIGHSWAVTFGGMGVVYSTLLSVSHIDPQFLNQPAAIMLGIACLATGIATAGVLGQGRSWPKVIVLGLVVSAVQYGLIQVGLSPLAALGAGLTGVLVAILFGYRKGDQSANTVDKKALRIALLAYGFLTLVLTILALPGPIRSALSGFFWQMQFPEMLTSTGFFTPAGLGPSFSLFLHPGSAILLVALGTYALLRLSNHCERGAFGSAAKATWNSAAPATVGVLFTVGLATLMEACGMTQLLAEGVCLVLQGFYPIASPLIGVLGAFATGSNNNSNVLFASLQRTVAELLGLAPAWLVAAQTTGGALGSMIAPPKIIVGCSTV
ncbi:MAG TPA: L-lactate permease, partial [Longilinea sp.]|nr:L-lactate permease [Longilinea sp.]